MNMMSVHDGVYFCDACASLDTYCDIFVVHDDLRDRKARDGIDSVMFVML
jgi:hypothetical protein